MTDVQSTNENRNVGSSTGAGENKLLFSTPVAIIVAGLIVAVAIIYSNGRSSGPGNMGQPQGGSPQAQGQQQPSQVQANAGELFTDADAFLGDPEANVVIVEFADFQCPFCGRLHRETLPQIIDKYVKTGKARLVYKHFAFLGQESQWAAEASECAKDQGKFWQYHDFLYNYLWDTYYAKGQNGENVGAFTKDNLKKYAQSVGLDTGVFSQCLDSGKYTKKVQADVQVGKANGVNGTPATFVNGKFVVGAQPFSAFESVIEQALSE